ncbi:NSFL1 cofactor p47-like [Oscarella lobularis]|uniref:NSFL1 cofactor p47-like n=1 Tax=Oscarella lobularis TaxID=121494 RepID=UPI0033142E21
MISGPPRKKADPKSMAQAVFDAGKKQGAKTLEDEEREEEMRRQAAAKSNAFRGAGYRLGETEGDTVKIVGEPFTSASKQGQIRQTLRFWQNGFTIDDGPLRDGSTDADRLFLHSVAREMIPQELIAAVQGDEVDLNVEDRRQENYAPPKKTLKAFRGEGHKLGSPVPDVVSSVPEPQAEAPVNPPSSVHVDESQPITAVQIRLGNGPRLVQKFNHSHYIRDIRAVVDSSSPAGSNYVLMTTFPNKELTDEQQTLAEAKLLNAVVVQRYKYYY